MRQRPSTFLLLFCIFQSCIFQTCDLARFHNFRVFRLCPNVNIAVRPSLMNSAGDNAVRKRFWSIVTSRWRGGRRSQDAASEWAVNRWTTSMRYRLWLVVYLRCHCRVNATISWLTHINPSVPPIWSMLLEKSSTDQPPRRSLPETVNEIHG